MLQIFKNAKLICEEIQKASFVHLQMYKLNLKEIQKKLRGLHTKIQNEIFKRVASGNPLHGCTLHQSVVEDA